MRRKAFIGLVVVAVLAVISAVVTPAENEGLATVYCEMPTALAGKPVDLIETSQAPCVMRADVRSKQPVFWVFGVYTRTRSEPVRLPAKDMYAHLAAGETVFPAERAEYCFIAMAEFVQNNKDLLIETAKRNSSHSFTVNCNEQANV